MVRRHRWLIGALVTVGLAVTLALFAAGGQSSLAADGIIYVDADAGGANDGTSWGDAFTDLQDALGAAVSGNEIWVAEGTYKPTDGADRLASFQMKNGVAIYGGFDPSVGADAWEERDWEANPTILSGDIGDEGNPDDNSYHVFYHPAEYMDLDSSAILDGFTITGGNADGDPPHFLGGGMFNFTSSPALTNCTFTGNTADVNGGGMANGGSSPTLTNVTFAGNTASEGGGMYNMTSSPTLTDVTFTANAAEADGGGMFNSSSSPSLTNCTFAGNTADVWGGGMLNFTSSPALTNCTFTGNTAANGGGMLNYDSSPTLTNCILWGDTLPELVGDSATVTYSDIQGDLYPGTGNINADPLFVDPDNGDFHLGSGSPCIDAGDNDAPDLRAYDFEGDPRILEGDGDGEPRVDMGVDEVWGPPPPVVFVDLEAAGTNSGTSWADAFTDLQVALAWAEEGVEIWVAAGTYKPTWTLGASDPRSATFQMKNGVAIYAGFDPSVGDYAWEERDWVANLTILSGDIGDEGNPDDNSYHVFYHPSEYMDLDSTAILDGFTITGGNAASRNGGGMYNDGSSPTLTNVTFAGNSGDHGGGMSNYNSSPTVTDCTFEGNSASWDGAGMYNSGSSPVVSHCTFSGNSAGWGAGMYNLDSSPTVTDCTFSGNSADAGGGGMLTGGSSSSPVVANCTFSSNHTGGTGGGMRNAVGGSSVVTNCTFTGNSAATGGGMYNEGSSVAVTNCILWGDIPEEIYNSSSTPDVTYSDIQGNLYPGTGNINVDPIFVDAASGDLHLGPGSPCIDTGTNDAPYLPPHDFEGNTRIMDGDRDGVPTVDMGVDEAFGYRVHLPLVLRAY